MVKKIKRIIILFLIIIILFASLPFFISKKESHTLIDDELNKLKSDVEQDVLATLISTPKQAMDSRIALINEAKQSINISYYRINAKDKTSSIYLGALLSAANRGVNITIAVDAKFGGFDSQTLRSLSHKNISVYHYNPIDIFNPESIQVSLHNKIMIVDDTYVLSGGRNISDTFLSDDYKSSTSHDLDVLIKTEKEAAIMKSFNKLYDEIINSKHSKLKNRQPNTSSKKIQEGYVQQFESFLIPQNYLNDLEDQMVLVDDIHLLYSSLKPENKSAFIGHTMYHIAMESDGDIIIQTPYSIGDKRIISALENLQSEKTVTLLTNSLTTSPNYPAFSNYLLQRRKFTDTGIQIYEYQSVDQSSLHTKAYVLGDNITSIGSMNLDNRSLFINSEQMLIINSEQFQTMYLNSLEEHLKQSNYLSHDINEYKKTHEKNVPLIKKIIMLITGILLRPFQSLL